MCITLAALMSFSCSRNDRISLEYLKKDDSMIIQSDKYKAGIMALGDELAKETDQKGKDDILEKISDHTQSTSVYVSDDVFIDRIYEEISGL